MKNPKPPSKVQISNALIDACYRPDSLYQMRLLLATIAQVKPSQRITHNTEFRITAQGIADLIGMAEMGGSYYNQLARAARDLRGMFITIYEYHDGRKRRGDRTEINFVSRCQYVKSEGWVSLQFTPAIIPYITELKGRYKSYLLSTAMKMRSGYGIRLYEQCLRWGFRNEWEVSVEDFRDLMGLQDKYSEVGELKRRVIEPAMRDVNEFTEFRIRFGQRKVARRITHFQFAIESESTAPARTLVGKKGKKNGKQADGRQMRIRDLICEIEGLDRLISSESDPNENERALMEQRAAARSELDALRKVPAGTV